MFNTRNKAVKMHAKLAIMTICGKVSGEIKGLFNLYMSAYFCYNENVLFL